jgi:hypothetical protein
MKHQLARLAPALRLPPTHPFSHFRVIEGEPLKRMSGFVANLGDRD